ncbi:MAG: RrF2 family transcriptional regulator [Kiritimatiellia bacterium]
MFCFSTRGRYAVRMLVRLAVLSTEKQIVTKEEIARAEGISPQYAEQILIRLKTAGFVVSQRGRRGGYTLSEDPSAITLKNLLEVTEGQFELVPCVTTQGCSKKDHCVMNPVWAEINTAVQRLLAGVTLRELAERASELRAKTCLTFEI